ncbi:MAG: SAM-dependent methyltransferase [Leptolinea sp.]|jgi:methyltransferase (TIGR00027 family)|nr:SAM-dependent methyltransferase [Leptolinea sp.]
MIQEKRIVKKSSQTATYTCFSRGCATREKDPQFRGPDYLAECLFPPLARIMLNVTPLRRFVMQKMFPPGIHEYVLARTKAMDDAFVEALDSAFDQIVLLGAGFDTRSLRFANHNRGTKIFELDAPTTQQEKIDVLHRKNLAIPKELIFTPIDFDRQDILEVLSKSGYRTGMKNLFLWEGVTMYLTADAVDSILSFIRRTSATGSLVVFDYIFASVLRKENRLYGEEKGYDMVARVGENWTFGLEEDQIGTFLKDRGFCLIRHFSPQDLQKEYLTRPDGTSFARINETHSIAKAEIVK